MKKSLYYLLALLLCSLPVLGSASQITIFDNQKNTGGNAWHNHENEDQEVEPGAAIGQNWDLEGMFFDGTYLSIIGGWDFVNGSGNDDGVGSGDIFIRTQGNVTFGQATPSGNFLNYYGYNYVFDVDWKNKNYSLMKINTETRVTLGSGLATSNPVGYYSDNNYKNNGELIHSSAFTYEAGLTDDQTGFKGGNHYRVSGFDLSGILDSNGSFTAHFTQECGNDSIMGQVPEPATMILLGMGLLGISAIARKLPL